MGKLITIWGSPNSGKTSVSVKLACMLCRGNDSSEKAVILILTDLITPAVPVLFPNSRAQDLFSLGSVLSKPDITPYDVAANLMTSRNMDNFGVLGYRAGENRHSFPVAYNEEKIEKFYAMLCTMADYVIVDGMSVAENDLLTDTALRRADTIIRIAAPDLKCLSFLMSQSHIEGGQEKSIQVLNVPSENITAPVSDVASHLGRIYGVLPYSPMLAQQMAEGRMMEPLRDKRYVRNLQMIAERVR